MIRYLDIVSYSSIVTLCLNILSWYDVDKFSLVVNKYLRGKIGGLLIIAHHEGCRLGSISSSVCLSVLPLHRYGFGLTCNSRGNTLLLLSRNFKFLE